jgi:hypothetical protein
MFDIIDWKLTRKQIRIPMLCQNCDNNIIGKIENKAKQEYVDYINKKTAHFDYSANFFKFFVSALWRVSQYWRLDSTKDKDMPEISISVINQYDEAVRNYLLFDDASGLKKFPHNLIQVGPEATLSRQLKMDMLKITQHTQQAIFEVFLKLCHYYEPNFHLKLDITHYKKWISLLDERTIVDVSMGCFRYAVTIESKQLYKWNKHKLSPFGGELVDGNYINWESFVHILGTDIMMFLSFLTNEKINLSDANKLFYKMFEDHFRICTRIFNKK